MEIIVFAIFSNFGTFSPLVVETTDCGKNAATADSVSAGLEAISHRQ